MLTDANLLVTLESRVGLVKSDCQGVGVKW